MSILCTALLTAVVAAGADTSTNGAAADGAKVKNIPQQQPALAQQQGGGAVFGGGQAGNQGGRNNRGGRAADNGEALVDLIQKTVAPQSWDVNGGQGRIVYFGSRRVLVVRNSQQVQGQVGGAIQQLRRN